MCPAGTTTTVRMAAVAVTDCNACRPGFGAFTSNAQIDLTKPPTCSLCGSGSYSPGNFAGGQNCMKCPQAQDFSGKMVSRQGIFTPEVRGEGVCRLGARACV